MSSAERRESKVGLPLLVALSLIVCSLGYFVFRTYGGTEPSDDAQVGERPANPDEDRRARSRGGRAAVGDPVAGITGAPPERIGSPVINEAHDAVYDPQRVAMRRGLQITSLDAGGSLPFEPVERAATITSLTGTVPFEFDSSCTVRVLPARNGRFNCLVRVVCGGRVVYPNQAQTAGFVRCDVDARGQPLRGADRGHSALDGDPLIRFDLAAGEVVVEDRGDRVDAFRVAVRLRP